MDKWTSVDDALDFAIKGEERAAAFYKDLAAKSKDVAMKAIFESFAKEEQGHKAKLERIKADGHLAPAAKKIANLKIAEYVVDVTPDGELDYQGALILAMKREKASFKLYSDLAMSTTDDQLRDAFQALAQEEAKHKLRFEVEYDDEVLREN